MAVLYVPFILPKSENLLHLLAEKYKYLFPGTPFMALTGTADKETQSTIIELLALRNPGRVFVSPERRNIRIFVKKCNKDEMFTRLEWLIDMVRNPQNYHIL